MTMIPGILAFLLALLAALWLYGRREPGLLGLRGLSLLLLLLMVLDPTFTWHREQILRTQVVVDASRSMAQDDKWHQTQQQLQRLKAHPSLRILTLVDSLLTAPVDTPGGAFTDLSVPLRRLQGPLLLLTDGLHNAGPSPLEIPYPYPVSVWWPRPTIPPSPLRDLRLDAPHRLLEHTPFTLTLVWPSPPSPGTLSLFLDDSLSASLAVPGRSPWQEAVPLPGLSPGRHSVKVLWRPTGDTRVHRLQVDPIPFRALIRVYRPLPAVRALRHTLATYGRVEVWLQTPAGWRHLGASPETGSTPPDRRGFSLVVEVAPPAVPQDTGPRVILLGPGTPWGSSPIPGPWLWPDHPALPPLDYLCPGPPSFRSEVLLRLRGPRGEFQPLALWDTTAGPQLWLLSGQVWRWALTRPDLWDSLWDRWLTRLLQHQVLFRASVDPPTPSPGGRLTVNALFTDFRGRRIPKAWVRVAGGPDLVEIEPGRFQTRLPAADTPGPHEIQVLYGRAADTLGREILRYQVVPVDLESQIQGTDSLLLLTLARQTGGQVLPDTGPLRIPPPSHQRIPVRVRFARSPWLLAALLVTLLLEWSLRQRRGWL